MIMLQTTKSNLEQIVHLLANHIRLLSSTNKCFFLVIATADFNTIIITTNNNNIVVIVITINLVININASI